MRATARKTHSDLPQCLANPAKKSRVKGEKWTGATLIKNKHAPSEFEPRKLFRRRDKSKKAPEIPEQKLAGWTRLELATFCVTGRRSNQLSYHPVRERRANVGREVGKSSVVCAGAGADSKPALFVDAARFRLDFVLVALEENHHGAAADFAIVIEFCRQFFPRRNRDLEALQA